MPLRHDHRKLGAGFVTLPQMTGRRVGMPFVLSTPTLALRFRQNNGPTPSEDYQPSRSLSMAGSGGVAIFAKACFGHPSPSKRQKLNATANAFGAPIRPRHLVPTQQGVGTLAPNDLTPCRMAFYFVSTFAIAQTPTKQPALRLSRTKNLHFAKATFPGFSAQESHYC